MANFAQLDENNIVINVIVVSNDDITIDNIENEQKGIDFCKSLLPGTNWKQTSYNTYANAHMYDGVPLRKNYAGIGFTYDPNRDAFIPPKPYPSWQLVESTCLWEPPVKHNIDGKSYSWDEDTISWVEVTTVATLP
jgi:hypothetical protein